MRFNIDRIQFAKALLNTNKAISSRSPMPVLSNFKLDLNEKGLEITGTDGAITIKTTVPYMIGERNIITNPVPGAVLINADYLCKAIGKMQGETITLDVIDDTVAKITDGKTHYTPNCLSADEYPDIALTPVGQSFTVDQGDFCSLIESCVYAADTKVTKEPTLVAINFTLADGKLKAVATDTARVATKVIDVNSEERITANIPARSLQSILSLLQTATKIDVCISNKQALFSFDNSVISTRLVSGAYPNLSAAFPKTFNYTLQVSAQEFLAALDRVAFISNEATSSVRLLMSDERVELSAKNRENGSASESIDNFRFVGSRVEVPINPVLVADAIKVLKSDDVILCFYSESKPFVVKNPQDESAIELITPIHAY
ncbi:MAG: DNA polymerase III subunit beta [Firmicutes bacterium]|uniref:Beta sliding clamp n=1 Tax=Candidatus Alloenteromonas pullistercoris TaxID=2840785 RepID=A0A9D9DDZ2_9FIRM|nr:DNA polymerase III subunit beta [Candidatus Enteromonas pullistercoris]